MTEINPKETSRAYAFEMWMNAPNPMVTFFKTMDVFRLVRAGKRRNMKFNMLMCWCIGRAASGIVNTIVANRNGEATSCDIPFSDELQKFNDDYLRLTRQASESCTNHDIHDSMVIGTSALAQYSIDGAVGMYSGIFNNPFLIWGKYRRRLWKRTLTVSFQFHHTQMDGAHAARFLDNLQKQIASL